MIEMGMRLILTRDCENRDQRGNEPHAFTRGERGTFIGRMGDDWVVMAFDDGTTGAVDRDAVAQLHRNAARTSEGRS